MILSIYGREVKDEWIRLFCETGSMLIWKSKSLGANGKLKEQFAGRVERLFSE